MFRGHVYEIFDDREACLLVAFDRAVQRIAQSVRVAYEAAAKWRDCVRAGLTVPLEQLDAERDIRRLCVIETPRLGRRSPSGVNACLNLLRRWTRAR